MNQIYNIYIYERYSDLKKSKIELNHSNLWKIFEWYTANILANEYQENFYLYEDLEPEYKEENRMSYSDTGIDLCNKKDKIVQCKLRKNLSLHDCATFLASQNIFLENWNILWNNMIIACNSYCKLSHNLKNKLGIIFKYFSEEKMIEYCENLLDNPPTYPKLNEIQDREYQNEIIDFIKNKGNQIICIPTGTGKTFITIKSFIKDKRYLILVPTIILLEQWEKEILKIKPELKFKIQLLGDINFLYKNKLITICVFNSINKIPEEEFNDFEKIFVDEAHKICKPKIYKDIEIENETYIQQIRNLRKYENNVYLSATIDEIEDFQYYKKNLRDMIKKGYLCDYSIDLPNFENDESVCDYLLNNYRSFIIYTSNKKEGKKLNKIFNDLQEGSSCYIDCDTPKKERNILINKYKKGEIPFIVNIKVLIEGFDAPITKGVVFMHLSTSDTYIIQIIGRALRVHPTKNQAKIIIPILDEKSNKEVSKFLGLLGEEDERIKQSIDNGIFGGYLNILENNQNFELLDNLITGIKNIKFEDTLKSDFIKLKELIQKEKFISIPEYQDWAERNKQITNPHEYYKLYFKNWTDFLGIDTSIYPKDKKEWKLVCEKLEIYSTEDYLESSFFNDLPLIPEEIYNDFTNIYNELTSNYTRR